MLSSMDLRFPPLSVSLTVMISSDSISLNISICYSKDLDSLRKMKMIKKKTHQTHLIFSTKVQMVELQDLTQIKWTLYLIQDQAPEQFNHQTHVFLIKSFQK